MRLDDMPFARQTDYIRLTAITYQSFGLDKNKALAETSALFFGTSHRFRYRHSFLKDIVVIFLQKLFFRNFLSLT